MDWNSLATCTWLPHFECYLVMVPLHWQALVLHAVITFRHPANKINKYHIRFKLFIVVLPQPLVLDAF